MRVREMKAGMGAVLLLCSMTLGAVPFENTGWDILNESRSSEGTEYTLRTPEGFPVTVRIPVDAPQLPPERIEQTVQLLDRLRLMELDSAQVVQRDSILEVVVVPSGFSHQGRELSGYLPAGIQLYVGDDTEYDFRMVVEEYFLRIAGMWFGEHELGDVLVRAVDNPQAFLRSRDPAVLLERLLEAERRMDTLQAQQIESMQKIIRLQDELQGAERMISYLQETVYIEHTRGFFGGLNRPEPDLFVRAQEIRDSNPGLDQDGLRDQLLSEGYDVRAKGAALLLSIYYNEHVR